jgi:hypothetical protein
MFANLRPRSAYDVMAALALFLVVTGGTAFAVVAANQVNSASIVDGEVKNPDLDNDSVGPLKVKDNSLGGADVDESSLAKVPSADTVDGFNGAELHESGGFGLKRYTAFGAAFFKVDDSTVQRRVGTSCPPTTAVRAITQSGAVDCVRGPEAYEAQDADTGIICNTGCNEGTLPLSAGFWAISAKLTVGTLYPSSSGSIDVHCELRAGSDADRTEYFDGDNADVGYSTLPLQIVHEFTSPGTVALWCYDANHGENHGSNLRISAVRLSGMHRFTSDSGA